MNCPIIIKKEITDFLEAQKAAKIYTNLSDDITIPRRTEVWLKSNTFVTVEMQIKSDIVTQILLYHAGDTEIKDFHFYGQNRAFLGTFYAKVRSIKEELDSKFPVDSWKLYCKVFKTKDSYGKDLVDAKNVLNVLKDFNKELRDRFCNIEEMLDSMINENLQSEITFKSGDLLDDGNGKMYRFLGDKDKIGNYLFLDASSHKRFMDYNTFKTWQKVNALPILEETLKRFYIFFDSEFINKVLEPATTAFDWELTDSATINHNCNPFKQWVEQKAQLDLKEDITGLMFSFKATETIKVCGTMDSTMSYINFESKSCGFNGGDGGYREEFFNPFLYTVSTCSRGIARVLGLIFNIYETFSKEIAELNLTTAFIDIYSMWEQIQLAVEGIDKYVDKDLLGQLKTNFGVKPSLQQAASKMKHMDAFGDGLGSPFRQKTKTIIKAENTVQSAIVKMSEGNPGAMVALMSLMKHPELVKPAEPFMEILGLDSLYLYGNELYDFLIYCCENSIKNFRLVSLNHSHGNISSETIHALARIKESLLKNRDSKGLEEFKDWSEFKDCYPEEEDAPFVSNKEFHTWTELQPVPKQLQENNKVNAELLNLTDHRKRGDLIKQKSFECCDNIKQIVAKNIETKPLFSKLVSQQSQSNKRTNRFAGITRKKK